MMNKKMSEITVNMIFVDSRTGEVLTAVEKNSKFKTVMFKNADGKTKSVGLATINKHFEEPEIIETVEEPATEPEQKAEEPKKARKPRQKKENPARDAVIARLEEMYKENGFIKITYEKVGPNFVVLRTEEKGRVKYEFYYGQKELKINMKPVVAEQLNIDHVLIQKYYLPAVVRLAYTGTEEMYKTIDAILKIK